MLFRCGFNLVPRLFPLSEKEPGNEVGADWLSDRMAVLKAKLLNVEAAQTAHNGFRKWTHLLLKFCTRILRDNKFLQKCFPTLFPAKKIAHWRLIVWPQPNRQRQKQRLTDECLVHASVCYSVCLHSTICVSHTHTHTHTHTIKYIYTQTHARTDTHTHTHTQTYIP